MKIIDNEMTAVAGALSEAFPRYQELDYEAIAKSNNEAAGSDFESLLPVQLPDEMESDYNNILFTRKNLTSVRRAAENRAQKNAAKGRGTDEDEDDPNADKARNKNAQAPQMMRESYTMLANYLATQSGAVNTAFAQARLVLKNSQDFEVAHSFEERARLTTMFENELSYRTKAINSEGEIDAASSKFLKNLSVGNTHIIRPSERYQGGYDVLFISNPGALLSMSSSLPSHDISYSRFESNMAFMRSQGGHLTLPAGQAASKYSRALVTALFGAEAATAATQSKRLTKILPVDFNFKKMFSDAEKHLAGVGVDPRPLAEATPTFPSVFPKAFNKFFSIVAVLDAPTMAITEKARGTLESDVVEEALHLQPSISFTIAINLPQPIVSFITQTIPGKQIPLAPLYIWATVWASAYLRKMAMKKGERTTGGISLKSVPKYVLSASRTEELAAKRKELQFYTERGRSNEDHMFVSNIGTLNYCPKADDLILDNAKNYESLMEDALRVSYEAGAPLMIHQVEESHAVFGANNPEYRNKIRGFKESIKKYAGSMQAFSWDYNCILSVTMESDKLKAIPLMGAAIPDELSVSDYLRRPFAKSMQLLFVRSQDAEDNNRQVTPDSFGHSQLDASRMFETTIFRHLRQFVGYLIEEKALPDFQELVTRAAKELELTNLQDNENHKAYEWGTDQGGRTFLYRGFLTADLKAAPDINGDVDKNVDAIFHVFRKALVDSAGNGGSNLARASMINQTPLEDDAHYFNPSSHTLAEFKNVYNYLGGRVFYHLLRAIVEMDKRKFMVINPNNTRRNVEYERIVSEIMPLATVLSKYVPDSDGIYERGDAIAERNQRNDSITQEDIRVPGSKAPDAATGKPGMQMFPHQIEGHKFLRNAPRFAVLDIAPGGGKTIEVLSDIACLVRDKLVNRPLIGCPTNLVRNWVEDLHKITQGQWNVIPITAQTLKRWSYERLTEIIAKAPRNTVCVVGYSALSKSNTFNIIIGNHVEKVSGVLEFVKKFGFDYVALDESHRVKNPGTATHQTIKQLCTGSNVKYVRLATGTLISNKLTDVVGQAAMFNSLIFRTPEEYDAENHHWIEGEDGKMQWVWKSDTPQLARKQLARHSAVITFKRKEWAFMLPLPQEEFIPVSMVDEEGEFGVAHQLLYDAVLDESIKEIQAEMKREGSDLGKLMKGGDDDDDDSSNDDDDDDNGGKKRKKEQSVDEKIEDAIGVMFDKDGSVKNQGMDDATLEELSAVLGPYLQRLEMLLTDPLGDDFGEKFFGQMSKGFISNKVRKVVERIKLNFEMRPWSPGTEYKKPDPSDERDNHLVLSDVCDYDGNRYVLLPQEGAQGNPNLYYAPYISNVSPDKDPRWKKETHGKVIVFCRYKRSVNAIYEAMKTLAPELVGCSVKFHGDIENKAAGLDAFKSTPIDIVTKKGVQILIANEQSISEGHNLQMASRMIRVEAPWAPGELDQAAARIFRPDPKGEFSREHIYLDWILTDRTLEVSKMGRLISKMVTKAQFDEANNPHYDSMNDIQLEMKSVGLDALKERLTLGDISEYTSAYAKLAQLVGREFRQMRETRAAKMFDIEPEPMFEDASIIPFVPYVPNMAVPDRNNLGLKPLTSWLQEGTDPEAQNALHDPKSLKGKYIHTEMGNGVIESVRNTGSRITSVIVMIDGHEETIPFEPGLIYVSPKLTPEVLKKLPKAPRISSKVKKALEEEGNRQAKKAENEAKKEKNRLKREMEAIEKLKQKQKLAQVGGAVKKPAAGVKPVVKKTVPKIDMRVECMPAVINGFLALDAIVFDEAANIDKRSGFIEVADYVFMKITNFGQLDAFVDWLDDKFYVKAATKKRIVDLRNSFSGTGKRAKFDVDQAPVGEFKNFFQLYKNDTHTMAKAKDETPNGKPELKIYPTVIGTTLFLMADKATNPALKRWIGKAIPGVVGSVFKVGADSSTEGKIHYKFAKTNSMAEVKAMAEQLVKEGFDWINQDEFKEELKALKANHGLKK